MPKSKRISFVKGFRKPSLHQRTKAIGHHFGQNGLNGSCDKPLVHPNKVDRVLQAALTPNKSFPELPQCISRDDWLAQYKEPGQSYQQFMLQNPWLSHRSIKYCKQPFNAAGSNLLEKYPNGCIYILPIGFMKDDPAAPDIESLVEFTEIFYNLRVRTLPPIEIHKENDKLYWYDDKTGKNVKRIIPCRYNKKHKRYQIHLRRWLSVEREMLPDDALCMMGLTMYDLYEDEPDLFVAGMAAGNHRIGVFSLFRYDPWKKFSYENWFQYQTKQEQQNDSRKSTILLRSCRLLVHEIGHLLGIGHCIYFACLMNGSGHLEEDFRQPYFLCPVDLHKIYSLCDIDILKRYEDLKAFYHKHSLKEEEKWISDRIQFIQHNIQE